MASQVSRKFRGRHGTGKSGAIEIEIFYDAFIRQVSAHAVLTHSRPMIPIVFENGKFKTIEDRKEAEYVQPFLTIPVEVEEDFPGFLEALYEALKEFFGDKTPQPHADVKHLDDMRTIVSKLLKVNLNG